MACNMSSEGDARNTIHLKHFFFIFIFILIIKSILQICDQSFTLYYKIYHNIRIWYTTYTEYQTIQSTAFVGIFQNPTQYSLLCNFQT